MKIKLAYHKIPDTSNCMLKQCIAFEKYDGTNIHWVFTHSCGWIGYGTRRDEFTLTVNGIKEFEWAHPELSGIDKLWDMNSELKNYLTKKYTPLDGKIMIFTEYFGPNSFAGEHRAGDDMELKIFDVQIGDRLLSPNKFIKDFGQFNIARVIFKGKYSGQFVEDVRNGKYDIKEGVVVKGLIKDEIYMAKIKTEAYMRRLQDQFKESWREYWE